MPSARYVLSRLAQAVFSVFAVISLTFGLIRWMPGGPEDYFLAKMMGQGIDRDRLQFMMERFANLRTDQPLHVQYIDYMSAMLTGDLGRSIWYDQSVASIVAEALPWTIYLSLISMVIIFGIGIVLGAVMAYREGSTFDAGGSIFWVIVESTPYYVFALVILWFFAYTSGTFPISGRFGETVSPGFNVGFIWSVIYHSMLPIASLVITGIGGVALGMRGNSIRVLGEDYLRVARLRGLPEEIISLRYVGRNAILPMYTSMMISIGYLFGGAVILEVMFNYTGIGYYMYEGVSSRDYPLMMGTFLFITIGVIIGVMVADLTYGFVDPRAGTNQSHHSSGSAIQSIRDANRRMGRWLYSLVVRAANAFNVGASGTSTTVGSATGAPSASTDTARDVTAAGAGGRYTDDSAASPFTTVSDTTVSRRRRYWRLIDELLLTPMRVLWADWRARLGLTIVALYVAMGLAAWVSTSDWWVFADVVLVEPPRYFEGPTLQQPFQSLKFPLGTSDGGHDLFAQVVHATPTMFKMMAGGAVFATGMAIIWGLTAGYVGGAIDRVMMTIADILMTIPGLPLVIVLAGILNPQNPFLVGVIVVINGWAGFARALRSQVLTIREESYIEASQAMDISPVRILVFHVLPGLMPLVMVNFVTRARNVIVSSVALYFLGILTFSSVNWGVMLQLAYDSGTWYSMSSVHWLLVPICTIVLLSLGLILFGQGCDRIFNPRIRARHAKSTPDDGEVMDR